MAITKSTVLRFIALSTFAFAAFLFIFTDNLTNFQKMAAELKFKDYTFPRIEKPFFKYLKFTVYVLKSSFCFTLGTLIKLTSDHVNHYTQPAEQRPLLVIVFLPTAVSLAAFIQLDFKRDDYIIFSSFLDAFIETYFNIVVAMLFEYIIANLRRGYALDGGFDLQIQRRFISVCWPLTLYMPRDNRLNIVRVAHIRFIIWLAVFIRFVGSIIVGMLMTFGVYPDNLHKLFFALFFASSCVSITLLGFFHHGIKIDLTIEEAKAKFVVSKVAVAFLYYQDKLLRCSELTLKCLLILEMSVVALLQYQKFRAFPYYRREANRVQVDDDEAPL